MLILTRRPGESLYVGENIRITVLNMQGRQVKLGLEVPAEMTVYREEVYNRVKEENRLSLQSDTHDLQEIMSVATLWQNSKK